MRRQRRKIREAEVDVGYRSAKVRSLFEDSAWGQNGNTYTAKKIILKSMKLEYLVKHGKIIP